MNSLSNVGILGCGWLGKAFALELLKEGIKVKGTTTSESKRVDLENLGLIAYKIELHSEGISGLVEAFLQNIQTIVISVPPKFKDGETSLLEGLNYFFNAYSLSHIKRLIYVSSTGVFEDAKSVIYDENSLPNSKSKKGKYLIDLEKLITSKKDEFDVSILRLGGLIKHGERHPVHVLSGKTKLPNPKAPINLIEQKDAVDILIALLINTKLNLINHGVYPWHPTRQEYYTQKALELKLKVPEFDTSSKSIGKIIASKNTRAHLNFTYTSKI